MMNWFFFPRPNKLTFNPATSSDEGLVNSTNINTSVGTQFSYDFWAKINSDQFMSEPHYVFRSTSFFGIFFGIDAALANFILRFGANTTYSVAISGIDITELHHYAVTVSSTEQKLYIDGVLYATLTGNNHLNENLFIVGIMRSNSAAGSLRGLCSFLNFYNGILLTASEVLDLFNNYGKNLYAGQKSLRFRFTDNNENTGTNVSDFSNVSGGLVQRYNVNVL